MLQSCAARATGVSSRLLLLSFLIWLPCHAQQTTATLLGAVVDSSGAAVVGVKVSASSLATNIQRETVTDQAGNYTLPSLPAGATVLGFNYDTGERYLSVDGFLPA